MKNTLHLKYVQPFVSPKNGKTYVYLRRPGFPRIRLPGILGSPEFIAGYHAAMAGQDVAPIVAAEKKQQSLIDAALDRYINGALKQRLPKQSSRDRQTATLRAWARCEGVGASDFSLLDAKYINRVIADAPTLNVAYTWFITVREFTKWAVTQDLLKTDPCLGIKVVRNESDGHDFFNEDQIAKFEARWPIGTRERLLFSLLLYTGQRCSDVLKLGPKSIVGGKFPVKQIKTGVMVYVPVHEELQAAINAYNVVGIHTDTFLADDNGGALDQRDLNRIFRDACNAAGLPAFRMVEGKKKPTCVPHGLRKQFCWRLAFAGCTTHEIAALSGHLSLKEVERYTREFDRARAAEAGFAKLIGRAA